MISDTISDGDKLDLFLRSISAAPLEASRRINQVVASSKEIEAIAHRQLEQAFTAKKDQISIGNDTYDSIVVYNSFACLYMADKLGERRCALVKKHQLFVVKLLQTKSFTLCFEHLLLAKRALEKIKISIPRRTDPVLCTDLIDGVSIDHSIEAIDTVAITFFFVALQTILQYISVHSKAIAKGNDPHFHTDAFGCIVDCFHSASGFSALVNSGVENLHSNRYRKNCIKLIRGYYKLFSALSDSCQIPAISVARDCILLKLLEYDDTITNLQSMSYVSQLSYNTRLIQFVEDLSLKSHFDISLIQVHFRNSLAQNDINQAIDRFICDPSPLELDNVKYCVFTGNHSLLRNESLLRKLGKFSIPLTTCGLEFAKTISACLASENDLAMELTLIHQRMIDTFLSFLKNYMATTDASVSPTVSIIQSMHKLLGNTNSISRLRMLSNLLYNLGNRTKNPEHWNLSIQYECEIYKKHPTVDNKTFYETKAAKVSNIILGMGFATSALSLMIDFIEAVSNRSGDSAVTSQVVHLLVKILGRDTDSAVQKLSQLNAISEKFKLNLLLQVYQYTEKLPDVDSKTTICNKLVLEIQFESPSLQLQLQLGYYNINGITEVLDLPLPEITETSILVCEFYLHKLVNFGWDDAMFQKCLDDFSSWVNEPSVCIDSACETVKTYILFLEFHGLYGQMTSDIRKLLLLRPSNPDLEYFLHYKLAVAISCLGFHGDMYKQIKELMQIIKQNKILSIPSILSFKLLQLEYVISIKNREIAITQFSKILKFVKAKPELDISESTRLSLPEKFQALLLLAHFQALSARLNTLLQNHVGAFRNYKVALKILNSIMVKLGTNFPKAAYYRIKLTATVLLLESYVGMIQCLNYMGVSRDVRFYLKGLRDTCSALNSPVRKSLALYDIIGYSLLLEKPEEILSIHDDFMGQRRFAIVSESINLSDMKIAVDIMFGKGDQVLRQQKWRSLDEVNAIELTRMSASRLNFEHDFQSLRCLLNPTSFFLKETNDMSSNDGMIDVLRQVVIIKQQILVFRESIFKGSAYMSPGIIASVDRDLDSTVLQALDKLVSYKEFLLQLVRGKVFYDHPNLANQEVYKLLHLCTCLLSQVTTFRKGSTILDDLLAQQDAYLETPMVNDIRINMSSALGYKQLVPDDILVESSTSSETSLGSNFCQLLPSNWKVVGIDVCPFTGDLLLTECTKTQGTRLIRLDIERFHIRDKSVSSIPITELFSKFQEVIQQSNLSTKAATTSKIATREDRIQWWNLRFALDQQVKDILDHIERFILGGFKSVFGQRCVEDSSFEEFKEAMQIILNDSIESSKHIVFADDIIRLFYQLSDFDPNDLEDLFDIVKDSVLTCDRNATFNHEYFMRSVESLVESTTPNTSKHKDHIILIPSGVCNHFPWESLACLKGRSISRAPSYTWLRDMILEPNQHAIKENPKTLYLINPEGDLQNTETRFRPIVMAKKSNWYGYVGVIPNEDELVAKLTTSDLFVYLGHGGCQQYVKPGTMFEHHLLHRSRIPPAMLIGCSSASLKPNGILSPTGSIQNWLLCKAPMVIGNLWDVTDKDIDMFSLSVMAKSGMIEHSSSTLNFAQAVGRSRDCCTLKYLNGSAPIMYGLPLTIS